MIGVVDYDAGNLTSVITALKFLKTEYKILSKTEDFSGIDRVISPGVGEARYCMEVLSKRGLDLALRDFAKTGNPIFGICLGFQLLFEYSEERETSLLGLIPGRITRIPKQNGLKIPHMGWNTIVHDESSMFGSVPQDSSFYFVHSFALPFEGEEPIAEQLQDPVSATTEYGNWFTAAIRHENLWGTQFHPEKSGRFGLQILKNFLELS